MYVSRFIFLFVSVLRLGKGNVVNRNGAVSFVIGNTETPDVVQHHSLHHDANPIDVAVIEEQIIQSTPFNKYPSEEKFTQQYTINDPFYQNEIQMITLFRPIMTPNYGQADEFLVQSEKIVEISVTSEPYYSGNIQTFADRTEKISKNEAQIGKSKFNSDAPIKYNNQQINIYVTPEKENSIKNTSNMSQQKNQTTFNSNEQPLTYNQNPYEQNHQWNTAIPVSWNASTNQLSVKQSDVQDKGTNYQKVPPKQLNNYQPNDSKLTENNMSFQVTSKKRINFNKDVNITLNSKNSPKPNVTFDVNNRNSFKADIPCSSGEVRVNGFCIPIEAEDRVTKPTDIEPPVTALNATSPVSPVETVPFTLDNRDAFKTNDTPCPKGQARVNGSCIPTE